MASGSSSRNFIPMANKYDRVILLVDMDCFYCQVEEKLDPSLKNQPLAVVQYNAWKGGGIIAVNYAARARGVTRHMRGDEAKEQCPEIKLVKVPNVREKADLTKYREAGKDVARVLQRFTRILERASVDEAYLDITESVNKQLEEMNEGTFVLQPQNLVGTYAVGYETIGEFLTSITTSFIASPLADEYNLYRNLNENYIPAVRQNDIRLLIGASIASEIRNAVKAETSFECSAGIAHNKILAKLACGINKPNKQTILPQAQIKGLFETLPVAKIKGLGGKFGEEVCERLNVRYLGQLLKFTEAELQRKFDDKNGSWLYYICRGIDLEAVTPRFYSKSIGCCKKFPGRNNITGLKTLQHWLNELANEINERLEKDICENNRRAKQIVVSFIQEIDGAEVSSSRSAPLPSYDTELLAITSLEIIKSNTKQFFRSGGESALNNPIKFLGISVGKFETISNFQNNIQEMFAQQAAKKQKPKTNLSVETQQSFLYTNKIDGKTELDINISSELEGKSSEQIQYERSTKNNNNSLFFNAPNLANSNTNTDFKKVGEFKNISAEKIPMLDDSSDKTKKSFFFKALKKEQHVENRNSSNDCDDVENNNKLNINSKNNESTGKQDYNNTIQNIPKKSFFARTITITENVQESEIANTNISSSNELNCFINDIGIIQNKEDDHHIGRQNEEKKKYSSNININEEIESNLPIHDNSRKRKFDGISEHDILNKIDYRSQYVELATPELTSEFLQFTNCSKCGVKILNDPISIQTHQDQHFAKELIEEQRNEFRNEFRLNIISSKSTNNSCKKLKSASLGNSIKKSSTVINNFFKPSSSLDMPAFRSRNENQNNESSSSNTEICDICKLAIKVEDIREHKDFHMAKDLQRELNKLEVRTVEIAKKCVSSRKSGNSKKMSSKDNKLAAKPITQFFTQSNI